MRPKDFLVVVVVGLLASTGVVLLVFRDGTGDATFARVRIGDSKASVVSKLGRPTSTLTNAITSLKYGGEVWAYGKKINLSNALQGEFPFNLRFVAPEQDDFVVVFGAEGTVTKLQSPVDKK